MLGLGGHFLGMGGDGLCMVLDLGGWGELKGRGGVEKELGEWFLAGVIW